MVSSWSHDLFNGLHTCISNKTYGKPLCLIAYAKSLRKNNLARFKSAFACGFARLRAPAKHRRNAFAAKVGTALLTKSLHPQKNVAQVEILAFFVPKIWTWFCILRRPVSTTWYKHLTLNHNNMRWWDANRLTGSKSIVSSQEKPDFARFSLSTILQCLFYNALHILAPIKHQIPRNSQLFLHISGPLFLRAATMDPGSRDLPFHPPLRQCGALHRPGTRVSAARAILNRRCGGEAVTRSWNMLRWMGCDDLWCMIYHAASSSCLAESSCT